jgi:PPM family protein phosphatase
MQVELVAMCREGGRQYNEDRYGHWNDGNFLTCLICDGAGGHGGGVVAASTALESVLEQFQHAPTLAVEPIIAMALAANAQIVFRQSESPAQNSMRSTVVMVSIDLIQNQMRWMHCGDSRAYLFRDRKIIRRTKDHSLVRQLVDGGYLDDEAARTHPSRNLLLSALGSKDGDPEISVSETVLLQDRDVILLCSDGIWEPLSDKRLEDSLSNAISPTQWLFELEKAVKDNAKPNYDNYTALAVWFSDDDATRLIEPKTGAWNEQKD